MRAMVRVRRRAAGYTLIEMLVTIALGSIITGLSATLLIGLLRTEKAGRQHAVESRTLERLARQCRADAHRASVSDLPPRVGGPAVTRPICSLSDPAAGVQIEYEQRPREVIRRELRDGRVVRHEVYRFPAQARLTAARDPEQPRLITWQIEEEGDAIRQGQRTSRRGWQIVAELGRDLRIAAPPGGAGTASPPGNAEGQP